MREMGDGYTYYFLLALLNAHNYALNPEMIVVARTEKTVLVFAECEGYNRRVPHATRESDKLP